MASSSRPYDPLRLDVERFARDGARMQGEWPLAGMERLADSCHPEGRPQMADQVAWDAQGETRRTGGEVQIWLRLSLHTSLKLACQRCLGVVETPLVVQRRFRFVAGEAQAAALDAELEDDVLASARSFDLHALAEDELVLALPIVPRHDVCPVPLLAAAVPASDEAVVAASPFAVLADLQKKAQH
jgi:uncharacterized protein